MLDYFSIINKHIPKGPLYRVYTVHVTMVAQLALRLAREQGLSTSSLEFIEEASMLHDIGIYRTKAPKIHCHGELPYIQHVIEGREILLKYGLPDHAAVAANHIGVGGISKKEIVEQDLPLPHKDILCVTMEERIISYADLFFSKKVDRLFQQKSVSQIRNKLTSRPKQLKKFNHWYREFGI